ncbi:MAG: glycosyltransferase [Gemmatimonadota bacterium]|jgi:glycosyltransferase involved in cell wall biosynthesis|nr:glycosyltransferase [Gemmatimonadota bacterium]
MGRVLMRVAITTDWLNSFGGAERVLIELHKMFPDAPIYTTVHDRRGLPAQMQDWDVRTSFLQRIPFARRRHQPLLPLMPMAWEEFDFSEYDLVLTTNSACAKGVITRPGTLNICYCYTPCRYIWDLYPEYTRGKRSKPFIAPVAHWLRLWDRLSADRVDHFVAISHEVAARVRRHYGREAEVIYPPVDVERITPSGAPSEDFYLVVSRLVPYKRVDLAIAAANSLGRRLLIVGDGSERRRLESMAGPTVKFLGRRSDEEIADLYGRCRAFLFPGLEDFGIAPVEAQAAGRPVIAFGAGGALETVVDGRTGVLFPTQTPESLAAAITRLEATSFDAALCRRNAERFSAERFRSRLRQTIDQQVALTSQPRDRHRGAYLESA